MTLIWSFHLKYQQPPTFYLKAPTLLYVFIFIALRALRFEARPVLIAGGVAAAGWLLLLFCALLATPGGMALTRDYVAYLTSNRVLIGGEIDKIVAILMVTGIMAVALGRGRRLLEQAVVEQTAASELARFFAPAVATRIRGAELTLEAGHGELCEAAILNLDLRGFTGFATKAPPDRVIGLLGAYQAAMVPLIRKHGGSIDKFQGDGILATFSAASRSATYAADALDALDEITALAAGFADRHETDGYRPRINGAVASGRVLFGVVGAGDRLEYTVIGEAMNLSAKLEKANKQLVAAALCDAPTFALACAHGYRPRPEQRHVAEVVVPGVEKPLALVVLAPGETS
jgi:adenylate cyclase